MLVTKPQQVYLIYERPHFFKYISLNLRLQFFCFVTKILSPVIEVLPFLCSGIPTWLPRHHVEIKKSYERLKIHSFKDTHE